MFTVGGAPADRHQHQSRPPSVPDARGGFRRDAQHAPGERNGTTAELTESPGGAERSRRDSAEQERREGIDSQAKRGHVTG